MDCYTGWNAIEKPGEVSMNNITAQSVDPEAALSKSSLGPKNEL